MKQHITRKEVRNASYTAVILCDEIQNIAYLCGISPEYYNAGGCGWNWDLYDLDGVAVVGGYRSFPACMARIEYADAKRIQKHIRKLKTQRGRIAAAIRLIKKYAGL